MNAPNLPPAGAASRKHAALVPALSAASLGCILLACAAGSVPLSLAELAGALPGLLRGERATLAASLLELRLGRALSAFVTGAMLALAGAMMQALLRNPLADPYVLGVSGGAAVGALAAILFLGISWLVDAAAFAGAMAVALLLFLLARRDLRGGGHEGGAPLLLLTGVIAASGCSALVTLILSVAPDDRLRGMVFWLVGDLSAVQLRWLPWLVWGAVFAYAVRNARGINLLAIHAENAAAFGVDAAALRTGLFIGAALLTAGAVSNAGGIGFVGLIVPHACRFAWGPDHRRLLPAATLGGGCFLVLADTLARTAMAPQQLPVGVVTALIGVPVFLLQLHRLHTR